MSKNKKENKKEHKRENKKENKKEHKRENKKENKREEEIDTKIETMSGFSLKIGDNTHKGDYKNIIVEDFSLSIEKKILFDNSELKIIYGNKYGLIGKNGIGKTTLLNHINKKILPISEHLDILLVEQEVKSSDKNVLETVLDANEKKRKMEKQIEIMEDKIDKEEINMEFLEEMNIIKEELKLIGSDRDESVVKKILYGLGFSEEEQKQATKYFSGGWRMRIALAKALYMEPTLLILDEPTNHLDLNAVLWLTNYLITWKKGLLIVSHNQTFLNDICTDILHIDNFKINYYKGNYINFIKKQSKNKELEQTKWVKYEKQIKAMKKNNTHKDKINEFIRIQNIKKPEKEYKVNIDFGNPTILKGELIKLENVCFGYNKLLLNNVNIEIYQNSRITIVGPNGVGKTTLINLIVNNLESTQGDIYRNQALKIAYYNQHFINILPQDKTPVDYLLEINGKYKEQEIRQMLGIIGLEGYNHKKIIGELSGGQKARVVLVYCQILNPHLLVMDEPTNHLDIETINGLIEGINNFKGAIILVTHDMELITETNSDLWVIENKKIKKYKGDYEDYKEDILNN